MFEEKNMFTLITPLIHVLNFIHYTCWTTGYSKISFEVSLHVYTAGILQIVHLISKSKIF